MNTEKQKTILLVEDEAIIAMSEKMTLINFGYNVIIAASGEEAVATVAKTPDIDLILMDIDLGKGMDGTEAAEIILQDRNIPIVFLSSHTEPEIVARTEKITAYGFIVKNSSATVFQALIKMVFKLFVSKSREMKKENRDDVAFEALRASEERYRAVFDSAPVAILLTIPDGRILTANSAACRMFEMTEEEIKERGRSGILDVSDPRLAAALAEREQTGKFNGELTLIRKTGSRFTGEVSTVVFKNRDGTSRASMIIRDITQLKLAEEALKASEARAQALLKAIPDMLFRVNRQGVYLDYRANASDLYDQSGTSLIGKKSRDILPADFSDLLEAKVNVAMESGALQTFEYQLPMPGQGVRDYEARMAASGSDEVTAIIRDITESKRAEAALQKSEMQRKAMLENSPVVILLIQEGKLIYMNPAAEKMIGWQEEEFIGKSFAIFVHKDDIEIAVNNNRERMAGNSFLAPYVLRIIKKTGGFIYAEINGTVIDLDGKPTMLGFLTDITERKRAEEEIRRQLAEKEIFLKEVHHRIKNNIASIGGILSMHMQAITSPEAVAALQDAIGRVDSMRLLYDKLLLSGDFQDVSTKNYVESLATAVVSMFPDQAKVKLDLDVDDFTLDPKRLFPLGIIINELLTNIMKYAFTGKKSGAITLALTKDGSGVRLTLQDNGGGLPSGFDISASKGFGLMLVKMLSQQLGGSFSIESHKGTRCLVEFND